MQVRHAHHRGELLQHEEDRAVLHQRAPVAAADHVALLLGEVVVGEGLLRVIHHHRPVLGDHQVVQELVQPIVADAALEVEGIGAFELFDALELVVGPGPCGGGLFDRHGLGLVLIDRGHDRGHRGQVVALVHPLHDRRQGAAGDQPHDEFRAFHTAQAGVVGVGHAGQGDRVLLVELDQLLVPWRVVEAAALALDLVRQPPGGD